MIKLYLMEAAPLHNKDIWEKAFVLADSDRKERIARMRQDKSRVLCMAASLLLSYSVAEHIYMSREQLKDAAICLKEVKAQDALAILSDSDPLKIEITPRGKPFLKEHRGLFYNLSHSGEYAICALSDKEVGVDIQKWRGITQTGIADRILHEKERETFSWDKEGSEEEFFRYWAAKEAYVKCSGEGLLKDFREILVDFPAGEVIDTKTNDKRKLYMIDNQSGYSIAACEDFNK